jgi:hypothetical protein
MNLAQIPWLLYDLSLALDSLPLLNQCPATSSALKLTIQFLHDKMLDMVHYKKFHSQNLREITIFREAFQEFLS